MLHDVRIAGDGAPAGVARAGAHPTEVVLKDVDSAIRYFRNRCPHCLRALHSVGYRDRSGRYCDEICARAEAALRRRLQAPPPTRSAARLRRALGIGVRLVGVPVPPLAVAWLVSRYLT